MAARETLDQWADTLDRTGELYCHVIETVADLKEQTVDLAGSTSQGKPPPLPGGMRLVLAGPHNLHAPPDDTAHPGVFLEKWCAHVGRKSRALPPGRTRTLELWQARLLWLRERLQWIEAEEEFQSELRAVHGLLRNVTNADRNSRGETEEEAERRADDAAATLQARAHEIPGHFLLTRPEAERIWPVFRVTTDEYLERFEHYKDDPDSEARRPMADLYWDRVKLRKHYYTRRGDSFPIGLYPALIVREVADSITE